MNVAALELNDAGLLVVDPSDPNSPRGAPSPGYALLDGDTLLTGPAAVSRSRLKPRFVHNRFWCDLEDKALGRPFPDRLTIADLAHAHLTGMWELAGAEADEVILAVPGTFTDPQLGLILGIARAAGLQVRGMVDAAVAAASRACPGTRLLHIDLQLHRTVVTELSQSGEIVRGRVEQIDGAGWVAILDRLARTIAGIFLRDTRFDPTDSAKTEQRLYAGLPHWLARLREEEAIPVRFESGGKEYGIKLARPHLVEALDGEYRRIAQLVSSLKPAGMATTLLLSHRARRLPGLEDRLGEIRNSRIFALAETAAAAGALACADRIRTDEEELPFVTRLPARPDGGGSLPQAPPARRRPVEEGQPTHLLLDGKAYAITEAPFVLGLAIPDASRGIDLDCPPEGISRSHCSLFRSGPEVVVEDHSAHGTFVNGEKIVGRSALAVGDRLRLGSPGVEILLIQVTEDDGTP